MKNKDINELIDFALKDMGVDMKDIHHVEVFYSCPDKNIKINHYIGDEIESWWRDLLRLDKKCYTQTMVYNEYNSKESTLCELMKEFKNDYKYKVENDDVYPIWYNNGIKFFFKDKYNNTKHISHIYYSPNFKKNELEEICCKINYELHANMLEFYGYRHIDIPKLNAIRYSVTDREPVMLQYKVKLPPIHINYNEEIFKNGLLLDFARSEDFKSLVKFEKNTDYEGNEYLIGKVELLKDRE